MKNKSQIASAKLQISSNIQNPNYKHKSYITGFWNLFGAWFLGFGVLFCYAQDTSNQQNAPANQPQQQQPQQPSQPPQLTEEQKAQIQKLKMEASLKQLLILQQAKYTNVDNYTARFNYIQRNEYSTYRATGDILVSGANSGGKLLWLETNSLRNDMEKKIYLDGGELIVFDLIRREATKYNAVGKTPYFIQNSLRSGFAPDIVDGFEAIDVQFALEDQITGQSGQPAKNENATIQQSAINPITRKEDLTGETGAMGGRIVTLENIKTNPVNIYNPRIYHKVILTTSDDKLKREIRSLELWVNKETFLIEHVMLARPNGTSVLIDLNDVKVNTDIPADKFAVSLDGFRVGK